MILNHWIKLGLAVLMVGILPAGSAGGISSSSDSSKQLVLNTAGLTLQLIMLYDKVDTETPSHSVLLYGSKYDKTVSLLYEEFQDKLYKNLCDDKKFQLKNAVNGCSVKRLSDVSIGRELVDTKPPSVIIITKFIHGEELERLRAFAKKHKVLTVSYDRRQAADVALTISLENVSYATIHPIVPPPSLILTINIAESVALGTIWDPSVLIQANLLTKDN